MEIPIYNVLMLIKNLFFLKTENKDTNRGRFLENIIYLELLMDDLSYSDDKNIFLPERLLDRDDNMRIVMVVIFNNFARVYVCRNA